MVETITPVVHGGRRSRYLLSLALHALGATLAAALVGLLAGAFGGVLGAPWGDVGWIAVGALALLYALREALGLPIPVPDRHEQVPLWWRSFYSPPVTAVLYGFGLGIGYLTYLSFGTYFVVTIAAFVSGNPLIGMALCAPFGLARAISVVIANRGADVEERPSGIDRIDDLAGTRWPKTANAFVLAGIAISVSVALI
ncbi:MAG: hypothetical protein M3174_04855 [Actinomycetota bacterium]|nr:hypothetical protein [Actinomycetota bacterium]